MPPVVSRLLASPYFRSCRANPHHIEKMHNGVWRMRVMVEVDPKQCGERIFVSLGTRDEQEAIQRRDIVSAALKAAGHRILSRKNN